MVAGKNHLISLYHSHESERHRHLSGFINDKRVAVQPAGSARIESMRRKTRDPRQHTAVELFHIGVRQILHTVFFILRPDLCRYLIVLLPYFDIPALRIKFQSLYQGIVDSQMIRSGNDDLMAPFYHLLMND